MPEELLSNLREISEEKPAEAEEPDKKESEEEEKTWGKYCILV